MAPQVLVTPRSPAHTDLGGHVDTRSLAQPALPSTRESRGLALYEEHRDEIRFSGGLWLVPSQNDVASVYEVRLGRRESCECRDFARHSEPCKHVFAATIARSKTRECAGCFGRFRGRDLFEVGGDHLTFFEGEEFCHGCAHTHGIV